MPTISATKDNARVWGRNGPDPSGHRGGFAMDQTPNAGAIPADARPVLLYDGKVSELFGIFLLNLLLTIITLGVFRFWAITRIRRYLWSHMRFEDTRFAYTGRGKELFFGFLLAILILIVMFAPAGLVAYALAKSHPVLAVIPIGAAYIGLFVLFGAAHFSAQRYRLSRTEWRGIRGGMEGSALRYGLSWLLYLLACVVTLYQAVPWMQVGLARQRINASRFGSAVFRCEARAGRLYLIWLATIVGYVLLLGVIVAIVAAIEWSSFARIISGEINGQRAEVAMMRAMPVIVVGILAFFVGSGLLATWYYTRLSRMILSNTTAVIPARSGQATLRFGTTMTAASLLWLVVSNALIALLTLGLGLPIVLHRYARYIARTTYMSGTFDANALVQSTLARPSVGEGFLQALDPGIV
jgi:uncharacterized membrane protein YjgN (DUF898 family)